MILNYLVVLHVLVYLNAGDVLFRFVAVYCSLSKDVFGLFTQVLNYVELLFLGVFFYGAAAFSAVFGDLFEEVLLSS